LTPAADGLLVAPAIAVARLLPRHGLAAVKELAQLGPGALAVVSICAAGGLGHAALLKEVP